MTETQFTRRLAAILAADVVGYSRMMGKDEHGTIAALREVLDEHFRPAVARNKGRVVKLMGDGALVEFSSVVDAVTAAVEFQNAMAERNAGAERPIVLRIGINLGDIVIQGSDIFGDGVNIAARLEAQAPPGGVLVSDLAWSQVVGKVDVPFNNAGEMQLKNITRLVGAWRWEGQGAAPELDSRHEQEIQFCMTPDGTQIAYATVGSGPPLVRAPHWLTHLEFERQSPFSRHIIEELSDGHRLIRFDQRGFGLSDLDVQDFSLDAFVSDMETVIDAVGVERFPVVALSQGCAISIAYAARHPERVSRLVLFGGFTRGPFKRGAAEKERTEAFMTLMKLGWGQDDPAFRQMSAATFIPDATQEQAQWFNELLRRSTSSDNAVRLRRARAVCEFDVTDLCSKVSVPTLVLHCRGDAVVPFDEGRRMAAMIPRARFVPLESNNHFVLESEPAWQRLRQEIRDFLKADAKGQIH